MAAPVKIRLAAVLALSAACATPTGEPLTTRATDFKSSEVRQPAFFIRFTFGPGSWSDRERASLPEEYEGALLEGLNANAVLVRDVQLARARGGAFDPPSALLRTRDVGADHAILIGVTIDRQPLIFCRETRPFQAVSTVWNQEVDVLRASDGAVRLALRRPVLSVSDVEPDCERPRESQRRSPTETITQAVNRLLSRLFGP